MNQEIAWMEGFMDSIQSSTGSLSQAGVGLGPYKTDYWTPENLDFVIANFTGNGGERLDIFRLLMDGTNNWPPEYWWTSLEQFMNGTL